MARQPWLSLQPARALIAASLVHGIVSGLLNPWKTEEKEEATVCDQPAKKMDIECDSTQECTCWLKWGGIVLLQATKTNCQLGRKWLNNKHNYTQSMLKKRFPSVNGWGSTLLIALTNQKISQAIQVIHCRNNHWIVPTDLHCSDGQVKIFDLLHFCRQSHQENSITSF